MERDKIRIETPLLEKATTYKDKPEIDETFKPNPVHLTIMKSAKKNGGIYDRRIAIEEIRNGIDKEKLKEQRILWNEVNLTSLVNAGYMEKKDDNIYIANPLIYDLLKSEFKPSKNHAKLLLKHKDGIIRCEEIKDGKVIKDPKEKRRQDIFINGMLKKLNDNGYIERLAKGQYKITEKGFNFLEKMKENPSKRDPKITSSKKGFNTTAFDRHIMEVIKDGLIDDHLLESHAKSATIKKRIETYKSNALIEEDGRITKQCLQLLENVIHKPKDLVLTIDKLSEKQLQLVKDMRVFLNLSKEQIVEHIYNKDSKLAEMDLQFLIQKKVIKKDDNFGIYIMDKIGIDLSNELYPDAVKYHTKLFSRTEEVEHDMLVYSAFQNWRKPKEAMGGKILSLKNDRQLRSEDAKKYGHMVGSYPDLKVEYKLPGNDEIFVYNLEVDCGYDVRTIKSKALGLIGSSSNVGNNSSGNSSSNLGTSNNSTKNNLGWYCKTFSQAVKVINTLTKDTTKASRMNVARKMTVYYMDKDGNLQTVQHSHWDK